MSGLNRFSVFPPVIKALLITNVSVFIIQFLFLKTYHIGNFSLNEYFEAYFYLRPIGDNFFIWQLLSYQFIHHDIWHIFFNLFALWMFGAEVETLWGSRKFLIYYLLCGIGAGLVQLYIAPLFGPAAPTIGASGSVYGVLLAYGLTFPNRPVFMFPIFIPIPAKIFVLLYVGLELLLGFSPGVSTVAHFAHLGGAAFGFLLLKFGDKIGIYTFFDKLFKPNLKYRPVNNVSFSNEFDNEQWFKRKTEAKPINEPLIKPRVGSMNVDGEEISQVKIDEILDKISLSGYQNLTDREKKILFELSKKLK